MLEIGTIVEGKVTGVMKFGAFVALPEGKSGLVHISEIAKTYVSEVSDHITVGQTVKVKIIGISEDGKINLSIRKALEPVSPQRSVPPRSAAPRQTSGQNQDSSFEDKLKQFMQESDSKNSGNRLYSEKRGTRRRK